MAELDMYLELMLECRASDAHLCSGMPATYRIDGEIQFSESEPLTSEDILAMAEEIMPQRNIDQFRNTNDTDLAYSLETGDRFRINVFRDLNGVGIVARLIPAKILTFEQLNLPPVVGNLCTLNKGLVLVTGPTGSGKSTTLAAMVDHINQTRTDHIITIEDPVEFVHKSKQCLINHREVGRHTQSFSNALRAALREDPDIVLVGEMRDLETVEIALETAETGHLVFGTLHTTTAASTVDRIIQQFPANRQAQIRAMLAGSLKGVVAQTLCKRIGKGRVAALEILVVNSAVSNLIRENKIFQIESVMQTGTNQGMRTLNTSLCELVEQGTVSPEEALFKAIDRRDLRKMFDEREIPYTSDDDDDDDEEAESK
ncbi:MAG: type IV pilus twitching motility protein PilT [Lentisphaeria bacterium]|nr:type IV pilus twitching motility protein PilT [Lentisphaeria bacterium]